MTRQEDVEAYYATPNLCLTCSSIIRIREGRTAQETRQRKFCSTSCAARLNNKKFPKRNPEGECIWCGTQVKASLKYCNKDCRAKAKLQRAKDNRKKKSLAVVSWRQRIKVRALEYKGSCCQRCGYDKCVNAMDFHHIDPSQKEFQIASQIRSWDKLQAELDKCVLLCANCHREFHGGIWKIEDILFGK
jgi:hypothetical protein